MRCRPDCRPRRDSPHCGGGHPGGRRRERLGGVGADDLGKFGILQVSGILQVLAFGLLFLNSSAAIVTYFVLPTAFAILLSLWKALAEVQPWVDLWTSQQPQFMGGTITGEQWSQLATGTVLWVVLPFVLNLVRVLRAEVK